MRKKYTYDELQQLLETHKVADKAWFLSLLDDEKQNEFEMEHIEAVMQMMRLIRIQPHKREIARLQARLDEINANPNPVAKDIVARNAL